jgi:hypothetical protein
MWMPPREDVRSRSDAIAGAAALKIAAAAIPNTSSFLMTGTPFDLRNKDRALKLTVLKSKLHWSRRVPAHGPS